MEKPCYIIQKSILQKNLSDYQRSAAVYYPVKCNINKSLLSMIYSSNACFEVETCEHLSELIKLGMNPNRILFFSPFSQSEDLAIAVGFGVTFFVVGNIATIEFLENTGIKYNYLIRIRETPIISSPKALGVTRDEANCISLTATNGTFLGFSFYLNSEINSSNTRKRMIDYLLEMQFPSDPLKASIIDIGGGINSEDCTELCSYINQKGDYNIIVEPGRGLINPCIDLVATVIAVEESASIAYLNVGIYSGLLDTKIKNRHFDIVPLQNAIGASIIYTLSGPTADSADIIGQYALPRLRIGDKLLIKECGAYSDVLSTSFYGYDNHADYTIV